MTREEAIRNLHVLSTVAHPILAEACAVGIAALMEQEREDPKPLTLDALRKMDGDKIYIEFIGACKVFYEDIYAPYYGDHEQYVEKYNGMLRACGLPLKYYRKEWLAYRHKPREEV